MTAIAADHQDNRERDIMTTIAADHLTRTIGSVTS